MFLFDVLLGIRWIILQPKGIYITDSKGTRYCFRCNFWVCPASSLLGVSGCEKEQTSAIAIFFWLIQSIGKEEKAPDFQKQWQCWFRLQKVVPHQVSYVIFNTTCELCQVSMCILRNLAENTCTMSHDFEEETTRRCKATKCHKRHSAPWAHLGTISMS